MSFLRNPINQVGISALNIILANMNIAMGSTAIGIICAMCAGWGLRQAALDFMINSIKKDEKDKNDKDLV